MRERRPGRFSDSKVVTESKLNRTLLEYHLDTLGSRKQEQDFEEFARKLCEYQICPNLRPQTGSTGGGDSKVDTETIPVSSQTRSVLYQGQDSQTKEDFAFAFSTQKNWPGKVRGDAEKVYGTGRGYTRLYCVTSEFARDKTRAELEDELTKKYGFRVVVLDRNWILDKVFADKREKIAIEELKIGGNLEEKKEVGPLDYQRKQRFDEINESIEKDVVKNQVSLKTVDSCLDAALIAAEMEQTKTEVENLFDRAIRFAKEPGTEEQHFTAIYQRAWTLFFWFEDFESFLKLYDEVEEAALKSRNIFAVERLKNLWSLIHSLARQSDMVSKELLAQKTKNVREKLEEMKANEANSSASVHADAMLSFMDLMDNWQNPAETTRCFRTIKDVLERASGLIGFPFEPTFQVLNEMDDIFSGNEGYEELQESLVKVVTEREGDISAGELLLNRGVQHMKAGRIYKAIDSLGRALRRFYKKESKEMLVHTLALLSFAYEDAGLLWAARGVLINAASHATSDFWVYGHVNTKQAACYERLRMIELRLGRIGYALEWHQLHHIMASQLAKTDDDKAKLLEKDLYFGSVMGLLLIKTPDEELKALDKLPDTLLSMDLDFAAAGLIYRLGGASALPKEFLDAMKLDDVDNFFNSFLAQPAQSSLPEKPAYYLGDSVELRSHILGCEFVVVAPNSSPEIEIGEYLLAALESFLSTTMDMDAASSDSSVVIKIARAENQIGKISYEIKKDGKFGVDVKCSSFSPHTLNRKDQEEVISSISEIVLHLVGNSVMFKDVDVDLKKLFRDEEVSSRAFSFSGPMVTLGNVLGYNPKRSISAWIEPNSKTYPYDPEKSGKPVKNKDFPEEEREASAPLGHDEMKNISIIRQHLWNNAGWGGVLYLTIPDHPPIMAFLFKNKEMAEAIFKDWQETFGREDKGDVIRISMVRGISKKHPAWYRAVVSTNMDPAKMGKKDRVINVSRIHTLTPDTTENLDRFAASFREFGVYLLAPALIVDGEASPQIHFSLGIVKGAFTDKHAWEIGPNDFDIAAITPDKDTDPIIPEGVKDPPILETLKKQKEMQARKG